jgi:hypothetical protein
MWSVLPSIHTPSRDREEADFPFADCRSSDAQLACADKPAGKATSHLTAPAHAGSPALGHPFFRQSS